MADDTRETPLEAAIADLLGQRSAARHHASRPRYGDTQDSDDIVLARIALLDYHRQRGLLFPGMDERNNELHALIDALIAAVRAEEQEKLAEALGMLDAEWPLAALYFRQKADITS